MKMKIKWINSIIAVSLMLPMTACSASNQSNGSTASSTAAASTSTPESTSSAASSSSTSKSVVAYFSRAGENYNVGTVDKGSTQIVAETIAEKTGSDLFHIETVTDYPANYLECTKVAQDEKEKNARPQLKETLDNFSSCDVIYLGYPIWWGDMPMAVYTFMESNDFTGKTIIPFDTHAGSGLSNTIDSIKKECPNANVLTGLSLLGEDVQKSSDETEKSVTSWLTENGMTIKG
jgi:Flavodoxins